MKFTQKRLACAVSTVLAASSLTGCDILINDSSNLVCDAPLVADGEGKVCVYPDATAPVANPNLDIAPPTEARVAAANQVVINYLDPNASPAAERPLADDSPYANWSLHIWNNESCKAWDASALNANWDDQSLVPAGEDGYGPYWELDLAAETGCINLILRDGNKSKIIDADLAISLDQFSDRTISLVGNNKQVFDTREAAWNSQPRGINTSAVAAHWVDANTILWDGAKDAAEVRLYASNDASFKFNSDGTIQGNYIVAPLSTGELSAETAARFPHLKGRHALAWPEGYKQSDFFTGQLYITALSAEGYVTAASKLQLPGMLDDLYTRGEQDADEAQLGAVVSDSGVDFSLWAPTAQDVKLYLYDADKAPIGEPLAMSRDAASGIWHYNGEVATGTFYRYQVTVYHYMTDKIEQLMVTDPYSLSLSTNSHYSQVVDLNAESLKPTDWDSAKQPQADDIVIYETHIRDFSVGSDVSEANQGKYLAFTETDSTPVQYLQALQKHGLTYYHLLPVFDIATVNEDPAMRVDLDDTVGKLCGINSDLALCKEADSAAVLRDLLEACDPATQCAETIMDSVRGYDSFNWGYDPFHFGVPEGSYASTAEGTARISEFRQMVAALHDMGLRVVMDVVYNHTNEAGIGDKSVLDKVVPGYYHRLGADTGIIETSTCCSNTATENRMMAKLMTDTLVIWARDYKIDSFRFDLMGHQPLAAMNQAYQAVTDAVEHEVYFYGEGWNFGEVQNDARFKQATQLNLAGSGIGSFSDRGRDAIRGGGPFDSGFGIRATQGFANGLYNQPNERSEQSDSSKNSLLHLSDIIRVELTGNLKNYVLVDAEGKTVRGANVDYNGQPSGYTSEPTEVVTYVSKHDNQTLWDNNQYKIPTGSDVQDRVRMQSLALSLPALTQGVPFIHMGSELLRSKSFQRDSYDSGDWYNQVDFSAMDNNYNVGLPRDDKDASNYELIKQIINDAESKPSATEIAQMSELFMDLLQVRSSSKLLHLGSAAEIMQRLDFRNTGPDQIPGLIVMSIDNGTTSGTDQDASADALVVVFNGTDSEQTINLAAGDWALHPVLADSDAYQALHSAEVSDSVASVSAFAPAVFVMQRGDVRGLGWPISEKDTSAIPPFGDSKIYLRGSMNGWQTDNELSFLSNGVYSGLVALAAGEYEFKIADANWSSYNFGYDELTISSSSVALSDADPDGTNSNIQLNVAEDGLFKFSLNASDTKKPTLTVTPYQDSPTFGDTTLYMKGSLNGWSDNDDYAFSYDGLGIYSMTVAISAGDYEFKLADSSWADNTTFGAPEGAAALTVGLPFDLVSQGDTNIQFSAESDANYHFSFDSLKHTLSVSSDAAAACEALALSSETGPLEGLAVRGLHSSWNWDAAYALSYRGDNRYQVVLEDTDLSGGFKLAADTNNWDPQLYATHTGKLVSELQLDVTYEAYGRFGGAGTDPGNNQIKLDKDARYLLTLELDKDAALTGEGIKGSIKLCQITE